MPIEREDVWATSVVFIDRHDIGASTYRHVSGAGERKRSVHHSLTAHPEER